MKQDARLKALARDLRKNLSPAERILWGALRGGRFAEFKFRRQHPFGAYILDFFCSNAKLVIEIDGETHLGREEKDERRAQWLENQGLRILRVWNTQLYEELDSVLELVYRECEERKDRRFLAKDHDEVNRGCE